jgi:hypothetical protein
MLPGLAIDGRFGMTAAGGSAREAGHLFAAVRPVVDRLSAQRAASTAATRAAATAEMRIPRQRPRPRPTPRKQLTRPG